MHTIFLTLFPEEMQHYFIKGIMGKAIQKGQINCEFINIRDVAEDKHKSVDDTPFGGGQGMLLKVDILDKSLARLQESIENFSEYTIIYTCPKGKTLSQDMANTWSKQRGLVIICGYYEGVDERIFDLYNIERVSLGDFVLSSGEVPAMAIAEATLRLIPGVIGNDKSVMDDSLISGLLESPHYTGPREYKGHSVPEILVSGHHQNIAQWQRKRALSSTLFNKPGLLHDAQITRDDSDLIIEILKE